MAISTPPLRVSLSRSSATTSRAQPARARRACQVAAQRSSQPVRLATRPCQTRRGDPAAAGAERGGARTQRRPGGGRTPLRSGSPPPGRRTPSASDRGRRSPDTKPRSGPAGSPRCRYRRTTTRPVPSALGHALSPGPQRGGARTQRRPGGGLPPLRSGSPPPGRRTPSASGRGWEPGHSWSWSRSRRSGSRSRADAEVDAGAGAGVGDYACVRVCVCVGVGLGVGVGVGVRDRSELATRFRTLDPGSAGMSSPERRTHTRWTRPGRRGAREREPGPGSSPARANGAPQVGQGPADVP